MTSDTSPAAPETGGGCSQARMRRLDELFSGALALPPPQRRVYLDRECASDPDLLAQVEALLIGAENQDSFLSPGGAASPGLLQELRGSMSELAPGTRIGRYRILDPLGKGGMGIVYLAERADGAYHQQVALKRIRVSAGREAQERFTRERQILATLDHPGIARLLDGGLDQFDEPFLVVERVEGRTLTHYCREERASLVRRLELLAEICDAVAAAHRQLVVHRDLKPSNILVTAEGRIKLLDFGIAKLLGGTGAGGPGPLVQEGLTAAPFMTPGYASPEQFRGERITVASDVYQIGLLAYEVLSGGPAYRLEGALPAETQRQICEQDPPAPSVRARATEGAPVDPRHLRGDLDAIVLKALRKEPEHRYPSVDALRRDLVNHRIGVPVSARPATVAYRARKFFRRHSTAVTALALAAAILVVLTAVFTWRLSEERDRTRAQAVQALEERDRAEERRHEAQEVTDYLVELFEGSDPRSGNASALTARELLDRGAARLETRLADQPQVRARLQYTIGRIYDRLGGRDEAEALLVAALELQQDPELELERAETHERLGLYYSRRGARDQARTQLARALAIKRSRLPPDDPRLASAHNSWASYLLASGRTAEAEPHLRRALEIYRRSVGDFASTTLVVRLNLARVWGDQGELRRSKAELEQILEIFDAHPETTHDSDRLQALTNLAICTAQLGDPVSAEPLFERVVELAAEVFGPDQPGMVLHWHNLATAYSTNGKLEAARKAFDRALDLAERLLGEDHPWFGNLLAGRAEVDLQEGAYGPALGLLRRALTLQEASLAPDHPVTANTHVRLGEALLGLGRRQEARSHFERCREVLETAFGLQHPDLAAPLLHLARLDQQDGQLGTAEELFRRAARLRAAALDPGAAEREEAVGAYLSFLRQQGRDADAEQAERQLAAAS